MNPTATLRRVIEVLDDAGIPHMLVGSFASTAYSEPRMTYDIDFVIDPTHESLDRFVSAFDPESIYIGPSPRAALDLRDQFNLIDTSSGWKVDFYILKDRDFDRSQFERRNQTTLFGVQLFIASPEDTVLAKLEWAAKGGSDRQVEDAGKVLEHQGDGIDDEYVDMWADRLGLRELLERARGG